jgi:alanine racemase
MDRPMTTGHPGVRPGRARLTIDLDALCENWRAFRHAASGTETAAVVKADGYGLGAARVASALKAAGCETFFVAHVEEGLALRKAIGPGPRVFVLNGVLAHEEDEILAGELIPVLNDLDQMRRWALLGEGAPAALHLDSGMNRLGLSEEDIDEAKDAAEALNLALIMSHLACASDPKSEMNTRQRDRFVQMAAQLPSAPLSLAASAGTLLGHEFHFDLVRPGIGLYGGSPFDDATTDLKPVVTLEAPILQVRDVAAGDSVGYGAAWTAQRKRRLATLAYGYADGFLRSATNRGFGVLDGHACPVVGRVSMDLIVLDVTAAGAAAEPGALVELLGPNAPLDAQAAAAQTIPYELLTNLGPRAARRWITTAST